PDGPRSVANAPLGTSNETSSTASTPPNRLVTWDTRRWTASGTGGTKGDPAAREHGEDDERDDGHADVGDGEGRRPSPVEVVHELVDADRGHGRRRREEEDHHRQRRDGPHECRHEPDPERPPQHRQEHVPQAARLRRADARPGLVQPPRCTSHPAKSANTADSPAATMLNTSVFLSASPLVPVATNSK